MIWSFWGFWGIFGVCIFFIRRTDTDLFVRVPSYFDVESKSFVLLDIFCFLRFWDFSGWVQILELESGGKPSTRLPPGKLVEHFLANHQASCLQRPASRTLSPVSWGNALRVVLAVTWLTVYRQFQVVVPFWSSRIPRASRHLLGRKRPTGHAILARIGRRLRNLKTFPPYKMARKNPSSLQDGREPNTLPRSSELPLISLDLLGHSSTPPGASGSSKLCSQSNGTNWTFWSRPFCRPMLP